MQKLEPPSHQDHQEDFLRNSLGVLRVLAVKNPKPQSLIQAINITELGFEIA